MALDDSTELARIIGNIYTEVFQRKNADENTVIKKSVHNLETQGLSEETFTLQMSATTVHIWGPGGASDMIDSGGNTSGRWGFGANWG